jgi:hypothetical protein
MKRFIFLIVLLSVIPLTAQWTSRETTIAINDSNSAVIAVPDGFFLTGFKFPALTNGTTSFHLLTSDNNSSFSPLWYNGALYTETIDTTGINYTIEIEPGKAWEYFKIVLNKQQSSARTVLVRYTKLE